MGGVWSGCLWGCRGRSPGIAVIRKDVCDMNSGTKWTLMLLVVLVLAAVASCQADTQVDGAKVQAEYTRKVTKPDGVVEETVYKGAAAGPSARSDGDKGTAGINGQTPGLAFPGGDGGSEATSNAASGTVEALKSSGMSNPCTWVGIACILAAIACVYPLAIGIRPAGTLGVAGLGFLVLGFYPAVLLYGLGVIAFGALAYVLYVEHFGAKNSGVAARLVRAVDSLRDNPVVYDAVKGAVRKQAGKDKDIQDIKAKVARG